MSTTTLDIQAELIQALKAVDGYQRANQRQAEDLLTLRLKIVLAIRQMNKGQYTNAQITLVQALEETKADA